jgi:hypothetical protein
VGGGGWNIAVIIVVPWQKVLSYTLPNLCIVFLIPYDESGCDSGKGKTV